MLAKTVFIFPDASIIDDQCIVDTISRIVNLAWVFGINDLYKAAIDDQTIVFIIDNDATSETTMD